MGEDRPIAQNHRPGLTRAVGRPEIGDHKQHTQEQVRPCEDEILSMHAALRDEHNHGNAIEQLFQDRWDHERVITHRIRRNDHESDLPGKGNSDEAIEKSGVGDGGGSFWPIKSNKK